MAKGRPLEVEQELIEAFRHSRMASEYLVRVLPSAIWRMPPPDGRGHTIAAIIAHMQSVRRPFARMGGARPGPPALEKQRVTPEEACRALRQSTDDLARLFEGAFAARHAPRERPASPGNRHARVSDAARPPSRPDLHARARIGPRVQRR